VEHTAVALDAQEGDLTVAIREMVPFVRIPQVRLVWEIDGGFSTEDLRGRWSPGHPLRCELKGRRPAPESGSGLGESRVERRDTRHLAGRPYLYTAAATNLRPCLCL
jgi:hypothetical protein